jgi:hypothetical protein
MSIILNQNTDGVWQFVVVHENGDLMQTSKYEYLTPEIALSHAQLWIASIN